VSQWIRQIEEDERLRMETPTERRTRDRREQIEEDRRYLARDGRFTQIVEDVHRLPDGPERREVFRRFWFNLYTQEYQNPLARNNNNNNTFTWSGPSGVRDCTGQRPKGPGTRWC
jgi:hypothetical protein